MNKVLVVALMMLFGMQSWGAIIVSNQVCNTAGTDDCLSATVDDVANTYTIVGSNWDSFLHFDALIPGGVAYTGVSTAGVMNNSTASLFSLDALTNRVSQFSATFSVSPSLAFNGFQSFSNGFAMSENVLGPVNWVGANWTVRSVSVPEPGSLMVLAMGLLGLRLVRSDKALIQ